MKECVTGWDIKWPIKYLINVYLMTLESALDIC